MFIKDGTINMDNRMRIWKQKKQKFYEMTLG